ncbi:hypothetical protein JXC34_05675 [Candidatus Woesearchaeota archaeon]|nr:hypothetical protein [Candidatus Woesearchaeota archaeon]
MIQVKMMNRKAQGLTGDELIKLIVALVGLLILMSVIFYLYNNTQSRSYDKAACQLSVIANSKIRDPVLNLQTWNIECPTRYIRFTPTGYTEESGRENPVKTTGSFRGSNMGKCKSSSGGIYEDCAYLEKVNNEIAVRIMDCWEQFGAGKLRVFNSYDTDRQCVICTIVEFDDDVKEFFQNNYLSDIVPEDKTLDEYMRTKGPLGSQISYYQYTEDPLDRFDGGDYYDYNFDRSYAIVFSAINEHYITEKYEHAMDFIRENLISVKTDEEEQKFINRLFFIEQEFVIEECDKLAKQ